MSDAEVEPVSETAFAVAAFRADESERADAVFRDPWARKLAGERDREFAMSTPSRKRFSVMIVGRTTMIDRLVHMALARGVDTVINLGAGLDTRPYRMDLPPSLRWIEIDFSHVLDYKRARLVGLSREHPSFGSSGFNAFENIPRRHAHVAPASPRGVRGRAPPRRARRSRRGAERAGRVRGEVRRPA